MVDTDFSQNRDVTAGVLVFDQVEELDFVGPWELLTMWGKVVDGPCCILIAEKREPDDCAKGRLLQNTVSKS